MSGLSIGEAARRAGVATSALRYYEAAGIIPRARRVNGQRRYDEALLDVIQLARFAQSVGFSLSEVRRLFRQPASPAKINDQWKSLAIAKAQELDAIIASARRMKAAIEAGLKCVCIRADDCLGRRQSSRNG